jgi:hypothetical protein
MNSQLVNSFQHLVNDFLFNYAFFRASLLPYLQVAIIGMERGMLIQDLEVAIICEESSMNVNGDFVILNVYPMMKGEKKVKKPSAITRKSREECQFCRKPNHKKEKCFWNPNNLENKLKGK